MTYSLAAGLLLEYLSQSKWLILAFAVLSFLGAIAQVSMGLKKKEIMIFLHLKKLTQ